MKSSIPAFIAATILLVITMTGKTVSPTISVGSFDTEIKLSSLASAVSFLELQPMLPSESTVAYGAIKNSEAASENALYFLPVNAAAVTVFVTDSGENIFAYRENIRRPMASLTKIMTAIIALQNIGAQKLVTFTSSDVLSEGDAGSFKPGESFSVQNLVTAMLTVSSNDAADALARFYGNKSFIDAMQQKAVELGMSDTTFFDSSGLTTLNQSTAVDLQKLMTYVSAYYPEILAVSRHKENSVTEVVSGTTRNLKNINKFAGLPHFLGGKTGYTDEASGNLISLFEIGGKKVLVIVLGTEDRFGETDKLYNWAKMMVR